MKKKKQEVSRRTKTIIKNIQKGFSKSSKTIIKEIPREIEKYSKKRMKIPNINKGVKKLSYSDLEGKKPEKVNIFFKK